MSHFHVVTGMPRSGSTLLQNILNQNPKFYASSTSRLSIVESVAVNAWSKSPETMDELGRDQVKTENKIDRIARVIAEEWHKEEAEEKGAEVVFDKGRGWLFNVDLLWSMHPDSKVIVCVRDLRDIFASCERHYRRKGTLDNSSDMKMKSIRNRMKTMFADSGVIGEALDGVVGMIDRNILNDNRVLVVKCEELAARPEKIMRKIYDHLGEDYYEEHQYEDVVNTSTDPDHLYLNEFPHDGSGRVEPGEHKWRDSFHNHIASQIVQMSPLYVMYFGYNQK